MLAVIGMAVKMHRLRPVVVLIVVIDSLIGGVLFLLQKSPKEATVIAEKTDLDQITAKDRRQPRNERKPKRR